MADRSLIAKMRGNPPSSATQRDSYNSRLSVSAVHSANSVRYPTSPLLPANNSRNLSSAAGWNTAARRQHPPAAMDTSLNASASRHPEDYNPHNSMKRELSAEETRNMFADRHTVSDRAVQRFDRVMDTLRSRMFEDAQDDLVILDPYDALHLVHVTYTLLKEEARKWENGGVYITRLPASAELKRHCRCQSPNTRYILFAGRTMKEVNALVRKFKKNPECELVQEALVRTSGQAMDQEARKRVKWSAEEEQALAEAYAKHNHNSTTVWRDIKEDEDYAQVLAGRTAVHLKDKWRVMTGTVKQTPHEGPKTGARPRAYRRARLEWTDEEEQALVDGCHRYMQCGNMFHRIKADPDFAPLLEERSTTDLSNKRRSMVRSGVM